MIFSYKPQNNTWEWDVAQRQYYTCMEKWENNGSADRELGKCYLEKMCRRIFKDK